MDLIALILVPLGLNKLDNVGDYLDLMIIGGFSILGSCHDPGILKILAYQGVQGQFLKTHNIACILQ